MEQKEENLEGHLEATEIIEQKEEEDNENNNNEEYNERKEGGKEEEEEEIEEEKQKTKQIQREENKLSYDDKSVSKGQLEILYKIPQKSNFKVYRPRTLNRRGREIVEVKQPEEEEKVKEIEAIIVNPKVIDYFYNKVKNKPIFMKNLAKIIYLLLNQDIESFPNSNEIYSNIIPFSETENSLSDLDIDNINKNTFKRVFKLYKKIQGDFIPENPPDFKNLLTYISKILEYGDYNPPSLFPKIFITNKYLLGIGDVNQTNCIVLSISNILYIYIDFPNRIIYPEINCARKNERKEKKIPKLYKNSEMYLKEMGRPVSYPKEYNVSSK